MRQAAAETSGTGSSRVSTIETFDDREQESEAVGDWIAGGIEHRLQPQEIGAFVCSTRNLRPARNASNKPASLRSNSR